MPTLLENLTAARDNLAAVVANQTAAWVASGCPPSFSVEGESYDWNNWLQDKKEAIENLTKQIQAASGPFLIRSRVRA